MKNKDELDENELIDFSPCLILSAQTYDYKQSNKLEYLETYIPNQQLLTHDDCINAGIPNEQSISQQDFFSHSSDASRIITQKHAVKDETVLL